MKAIGKCLLAAVLWGAAQDVRPLSHLVWCNSGYKFKRVRH